MTCLPLALPLASLKSTHLRCSGHVRGALTPTTVCVIGGSL